MPDGSTRRAGCLACFAYSLLALALPCAAQTQALPTPAPFHQQGFIVPFSSVPGQGSPLIMVWINSQVEATFIVDTGTNNCLISQSLVKKLGLTSFPALLSDGKPLLLEGKQPQAVILTSLQFGGKQGPLVVHEPKISICVLPDQQLRFSADHLVDGLIGSNLLLNFAVSFDFPKHTLILCLPGNLTHEEANSIGYDEAGGTTVLLSSGNTETQSEDVYFAPVSLENNGLSRQVDLLLDTGAQTTTIPRRAALELSLIPFDQIPQANHSGILSTVQVARPQALVLGDLRIKQPVVNYSNQPNHNTHLGLDILSGYRVLMDFPAKKMYLQPAVPTIKIGLPPSTPAPAKR